MHGLKIKALEENSTASEIGMGPGDEVLSINGHPVADYLSYRYLIAGEDVSMLVLKAEGGLVEIELEKYEDDDLGIIPEPMKLHRCNNKCVFCFVSQMPRGLRRSLYVKDEDYRHSFLYGNYITLTTLTDADYERIIREKLSPLYVSVHATDDNVRRFLLNNKQAPPILDCIRRLTGGGITLHTQAVVCPGLNDGDMLIKTTEDLAAFYPGVASLALVPVGLTSHRGKLYPLKPFTKASASRLLDSLEPLRRRYRKKFGAAFVYPSDEIYIRAKRNFPKDGEYDEYPQMDNGVGLVRDFLTEFSREKRRLPRKTATKKRILLVTGGSFAPYLRAVTDTLNKVDGLTARVLPVNNGLFGESVTVAGLLCGRDIAVELKGKRADAALIPLVATRDGGGVFLDDMGPEDIERESGVRVIMTPPNARGLVETIRSMII